MSTSFQPSLLALVGAVMCTACGTTPDKDAAADPAHSVDTTHTDNDDDTGADDDTGTPDDTVEPEFCSGTTQHRWDITDTEDVDLFPDGLLEAPNPDSPTGRSVVIDDTTARWLPGTPAIFLDGVRSFSGMSGFGTMGGVLLRFNDGTVSDVPLTADDSLTSDGWQLYDLGTTPPTRVPFAVDLQEGGVTAVVSPLRPLSAGTAHAFVLTTHATADDGGCIAPTATTRALLHGDSPPDHPHAAETAERYRATLDTLDLAPDHISAITVFTTHDELGAWREVAALAEDDPVSWGAFSGCEDRSGMLECTANTTVLDRRNADGLVDASVTPDEQPIPVSVWLPGDGTDGPFPVVVYGHGLGSKRSEGRLVAEMVSELGVAVVAMEAVQHGDHPTTGGSGGTDTDAIGFLGIDLSTVSLNPRLMRGNFDQTNLDRRRLLRLLIEQPDIDGDGHNDLDPHRIAYMGASLGAILGPQVLSVSPEVDAAVFSVGGARLMNIVRDTSALADFEFLIISLVGSSERFDRLLPVAQHLVDPVDPGAWAAHLVTDRFDDAPAPHLMVHVAMEDEVVPISAGHALARALDLPHMGPVVESVPLLTEVEGPLAANGVDGATHAFFQFDRVTSGSGVAPARHTSTPKSLEAEVQLRAFIEGWLHDGVPVAVDPYAELGTPPL